MGGVYSKWKHTLLTLPLPLMLVNVLFDENKGVYLVVNLEIVTWLHATLTSPEVQIEQ